MCLTESAEGLKTSLSCELISSRDCARNAHKSISREAACSWNDVCSSFQTRSPHFVSFGASGNIPVNESVQACVCSKRIRRGNAVQNCFAARITRHECACKVCGPFQANADKPRKMQRMQCFSHFLPSQTGTSSRFYHAAWKPSGTRSAISALPQHSRSPFASTAQV